MYTLTGEDKYRDMAIRVVDAQWGRGSWDWKGEDGTPAPDNDITAERVVWLEEIHQAVGHL